MILIKEGDSKVLLIICKTPHKINCSNQSLENDKEAVCRGGYHKQYCRKQGTPRKQAKQGTPKILTTRRK